MYKTRLLRTPLGAALTNAVLRVDGLLGLPQIVEEEIIKHTVKAGSEAATQIRKNIEKVEMLVGWVDDFAVPTDETFKASAEERLRELEDLLKRVPFDFEQAKAALQRVMNETPPNGPKRQQYKDSVIWESVLELSRDYTVHFVTEDGDFFEAGNSGKVLASNLKEDCNVNDREVFVHNGLESYLQSLRETVPPLDRQRLGDEIERALIQELRQFATDKDFELDSLVDAPISAFLTENMNVLALSFELIHRASVVLKSGEEIAARLITRGECSYNLRDKAVSDVRKDSIQLLDTDGNVIQGRGGSVVYGSGIVGGGSHRRSYSLRAPLDEE